jgi:threonine dehydratase
VISLTDIEAARERIKGAVRHTSCVRSESLSKQLGCEVFLKLENLQRTGSFKERGALNRLLALTPEERKRGVITASAGNHAQALSYHAGRLGIPVTVVMPETAAINKVNANRGFGARVIFHGALYDDAAVEAQRLRGEENLVYIHPFDNDLTLAGTGTIGLELVEEIPDLQAALVAVGGGGLAAGVAVALKGKLPQIRLIGVETTAFRTLEKSLEARERITVPPATTIADGIQVRTIGERTFPILRDLLDEVVTVDDEEISQAILALLEQEKLVAEGAGAAPLAALMRVAPKLQGKKVALVICGGNIDLSLLARIIERGLFKAGRRVKLRLKLLDRPINLAQLTRTLADQRSNLLEISHDRLTAESSLGEVTVEVTLEARGETHVTELLAELTANGYRPHRLH